MRKYFDQIKFSNINKSHLYSLILNFCYRINIHHKQHFKFSAKKHLSIFCNFINFFSLI